MISLSLFQEITPPPLLYSFRQNKTADKANDAFDIYETDEGAKKHDSYLDPFMNRGGKERDVNKQITLSPRVSQRRERAKKKWTTIRRRRTTKEEKERKRFTIRRY